MSHLSSINSHIADAEKFINLHKNLDNIDIDNSTTLKVKAITGYIYGLSSVEFEKDAFKGSIFSPLETYTTKTNISYTQFAVTKEVDTLKTLIDQFRKDIETASSPQERAVLLGGLEHLNEKCNKIASCLKCVKAGYSSEEKAKAHGNKIDALNNKIEEFADLVEDLSSLTKKFQDQFHGEVVNLMVHGEGENLMAQVLTANPFDRNAATQVLEVMYQNLISGISEEEKKQELQRVMKASSEQGVNDVRRVTKLIVGNGIYGESLELTADQRLEVRNEAIDKFLDHNEGLREGLMKVLHQGLLALPNVKEAFLGAPYGVIPGAVGDEGENALKEMEIQKREDGKIFCSLTSVVAMSKVGEQGPPAYLMDLKNTVTMVISPEDLIAGNVENAVITFSVSKE